LVNFSSIYGCLASRKVNLELLGYVAVWRILVLESWLGDAKFYFDC
jgi:hypothetical protein